MKIVRAILKPGADEETCLLPYSEGLQTEASLGSLGTSMTLLKGGLEKNQ